MELNQISIADLPSLSFHLGPAIHTTSPLSSHLHSITAGRQAAHQHSPAQGFQK